MDRMETENKNYVSGLRLTTLNALLKSDVREDREATLLQFSRLLRRKKEQFPLYSAMCDPQDPIPLLAVLTSSFCHLNDEEIAALKIGSRSLYEGVQKQRPEILRDLQDLRAVARTDGICALLDQLAGRGRFFDLLEPRQKANFDFLYEKAVQFERHSRSLYGFLESMHRDAFEQNV